MDVVGARVRDRVRGARAGLAEAAAAGDLRLVRAAIDELEQALREARILGVPGFTRGTAGGGGRGTEGR